MFTAVKAMSRRSTLQIRLHDDDGRQILDMDETRRLVAKHFKSQFFDASRPTVLPDFEAKPLSEPITAYEVASAIKKLRNRRAVGPDGLPAEVLKSVADLYATPLAHLLNQSHAHLHPQAKQAPGIVLQPRPIVLLNCIRKAVSILVLNRIQAKLDNAIGQYQSGFRRGRSTADAVWTHKWLVARVRKYEDAFSILGIDLSRAFDTIDRSKLLLVLEDILTNDEVRLVRTLLASTTLKIRLGHKTHQAFTTNIGTPHGNALSPVLFVVHLDAALRDVALA
ncbi:hypothetical protein ACHHYP_14761, partial [Achlya hypogyna]